MIADIKAPDTAIVRQAEELVRSASSPMLYNHVMRCYWFAELYAQKEQSKADRELIFLSSALHDLGFTELGKGPSRFEIEGAHAARSFLKKSGVPEDRAWQVWNTIALHTWDINLYKEDEARLTEFGILYDVIGFAVKLDPADVAEVVRRYPRLGFKKNFYDLVRDDASKPNYPHRFHICTCIAAETPGAIQIPDAKTLLNGAPFTE